MPYVCGWDSYAMINNQIDFTFKEIVDNFSNVKNALCTYQDRARYIYQKSEIEKLKKAVRYPQIIKIREIYKNDFKDEILCWEIDFTKEFRDQFNKAYREAVNRKRAEKAKLRAESANSESSVSNPES